MAINSFKLINSNGNEIYLGDYGLEIGKTSGGLPTESFIPQSENYIQNGIVNYDGGIFYGQKLGVRKISIPCYFEHKTEDELNQIKRLLHIKKPRKLIFDRTPYKYIWVVSDGEIESNYIWYGTTYSGYFEVDYLAYDPLYYSCFTSQNLVSYIQNNPTYPTLYFPEGLQTIEDVPASTFVDITVNGTVNQYNGGSYPSKCSITIVGSCTNLIVTNNTNGQSFTIPSMLNQTLIIDGVRGQIRDATTFQTDKFEGDFIQMECGDNVITLIADSINLNSLSFDFRYSYL